MSSGRADVRIGLIALLALVDTGPPTQPPQSTDDPDPVHGRSHVSERAAPTTTATTSPDPTPLRTYLSREVSTSPRFLNHGVVSVGAAGGWPHLYRLELGVGLLDHLSLGATAHWLPGQTAPGWAPWATVAFWRTPRWAVGAHYRQVLHPPPSSPYVRPGRTPAFQERSHYLTSTLAFSQAWFSVGGDVGVVRRRISTVDPEDPPEAFDEVWRFGGGVYLRTGTPRWGFTIQAWMPSLAAELAVDVRFGAFEFRDRRAGWRTW